MPYSVLHICSMPRTCATHLPHDAVRISVCRKAVMPASIADWRRERHVHVPRSNEAEDGIDLSVPRAQRRYAASLGALTAQYSNLEATNSKPKAAQCGASVNATATSGGALRDGIGSQCTL